MLVLEGEIEVLGEREGNRRGGRDEVEGCVNCLIR